jgi:isoleucyl-tRNA synthetase
LRRDEVAEDDSALCSVSVKANFKVLGKRRGARMKAVAEAIASMDAGAVATLRSQGTASVGGEDITLDEVVGAGMTVVLDTELTPELRREGLARELVNRIQNLRKDSGFDVSQRIAIAVQTEGEVAAMLGDTAMRELVTGETLAVELVQSPVDDGKDEAIDGIAVRLRIGVAQAPSP